VVHAYPRSVLTEASFGCLVVAPYRASSIRYYRSSCVMSGSYTPRVTVGLRSRRSGRPIFPMSWSRAARRPQAEALIWDGMSVRGRPG
jgi:hypothetical protein